MKILYLEDDAALRNWTAEQLREKGYDVTDFFRVDQVKEYFGEHKDQISIVITDLNMDDRWLENFQQESYGGYFTGWVWLEHFVYPEKFNMPTIIYSAYIDLLKQEKGRLLLDKKHIICVDKGVAESEGFKGLLEAIDEICIAERIFV